jgi:hypothetical protein
VVAGAGRQPRINKPGLPYFVGHVEVGVFLCDVDNPGHSDWTDELRAEAARQDAELDVLKTAGIYYTSHGRRIVQPIAEVIPAGEVEPYLRRWLCELEVAGVAVDWACRDWTRHFRLPNVKRKGRLYRSPSLRLEQMVPIELKPLPTALPSVSAREMASTSSRPPVSVEWTSDVPKIWLPRVQQIADAVKAESSEWHTLFMALAGALLARSAPPEHVPALCRAISLATGADTRTDDRERAARSTVEKQMAGQRITGSGELRRRWPQVAAALDDATARGSEARLRALAAAPSATAAMPVAEATAALEDAIRRAPDGLTLISAECGLGKTAAAVRIAAERAAKPYRSPDATGERAPAQSKTSISVDKNKLAKQVARDVALAGTKVRRLFGPLSVKGADGKPECRYYDIARPLVAGGQAMQWELCQGRGQEPCEYLELCTAYGGAEGPPDARVTIGPHALLGQLNAEAGSTGLLVIDEPPDVLETTVLSLQKLDAASQILRAFDGRYIGALTPALAGVRAWVAELGELDAPTELADAVRFCARVIKQEDLEQARRSSGCEGDAVECARAAPFPEGRSGIAPPIQSAYLAMARKSIEWACAIGDASKVLRAIYRALASVAPVAARIEQRNERVLILTGAREPFVDALRREGAVVVSDANAELHAPIMAKVVGYDPPHHRFSAVDGAPIERTLIRCRSATRTQWLPKGQLAVDASLVGAVRVLFEWVKEDPAAKRLGLITMLPIELALRAALEPDNRELDAKWTNAHQSLQVLAEVRGKLGPVIRSWPGQILFGHYGAVRGLNTMADVDCLATLGDPWPNLGAMKNDVAFLGLADAWEQRLEDSCRAELEQAHGRIRAVHRTRSGRALHIGGVLPGGSGWSSGNVQIRRLLGGAPKATSVMDANELELVIGALGGVRAAARVLDCDPKTVRRYREGLTPVPEGSAAELRRRLLDGGA